MVDWTVGIKNKTRFLFKSPQISKTKALPKLSKKKNTVSLFKRTLLLNKKKIRIHKLAFEDNFDAQAKIT